MADTVRTLGDAAFQEAEILDDDTQMDDLQAARFLRLFQDFLNELANAGAFGRVRAVVITGDTTAREQDRLQYNGATTATVTLPTTLETDVDPAPYGSETLSDQANVDNDTRAPRDHALAEVAGTNQDRYVYDALLGDWVRITRLALTDQAPLCNRWRGEFIAVMTHRVARTDMKPAWERSANRARSRIIANPSAPRVEGSAVYF